MRKFQIKSIETPFIAEDSRLAVGVNVYHGLNSAIGPCSLPASAAQVALTSQVRPYHNYNLAKGVSFPPAIPPLNVAPELILQENFVTPIEAPKVSSCSFNTILLTNQRFAVQPGEHMPAVGSLAVASSLTTDHFSLGLNHQDLAQQGNKKSEEDNKQRYEKMDSRIGSKICKQDIIYQIGNICFIGMLSRSRVKVWKIYLKQFTSEKNSSALPIAQYCVSKGQSFILFDGALINSLLANGRKILLQDADESKRNNIKVWLKGFVKNQVIGLNQHFLPQSMKFILARRLSSELGLADLFNKIERRYLSKLDITLEEKFKENQAEVQPLYGVESATQKCDERPVPPLLPPMHQALQLGARGWGDLLSFLPFSLPAGMQTGTFPEAPNSP